MTGNSATNTSYNILLSNPSQEPASGLLVIAQLTLGFRKSYCKTRCGSILLRSGKMFKRYKMRLEHIPGLETIDLHLSRLFNTHRPQHHVRNSRWSRNRGIAICK